MEGSGGSLLSLKASQEFDLLQKVQQVTNLPSQSEAKAPADRLEEYDDLFHGLGKLKSYQIKLHIDEDIPAVAQPHRRLPFHIQDSSRTLPPRRSPYTILLIRTNRGVGNQSRTAQLAS